MEKKDLKDGMFVELRDGSKGVVVNGTVVFQDGAYVDIGDIPYNLTNEARFRRLDIMKVFKCDSFKGMIENYLIWERPKAILDKQEKNYLTAVIKPFKDNVHYIVKFNDIDSREAILIRLFAGNDIIFPTFERNSMYKGMNINVKYSLQELGL